MARAKHTKTLCKGCHHGLEHHPDRGACVYGHDTVTGGCMCPAFNTPASKIPTAPPELLEKITNAARSHLQEQLSAKVPPAVRLELLRADLQAALDVFSAGVLELFASISRSSERTTTDDGPVGEVRAPACAQVKGGTDNAGSNQPKAPTIESKDGAARPRDGVPTTSPAIRPIGIGDQVQFDGMNGVVLPAALSKGRRKLLHAIASRSGVTDRQLMALSGFKETSLRTYMPELRMCGFVETIEYEGELVHCVTEAGLAELGTFEPLPFGTIVERLKPGPRKLFDAIARSYSGKAWGVTRRQLTIETGYRETSLRTYLPILLGLTLVEYHDDRYWLSPLGKAENVAPLPPRLRGGELRDQALEKLKAGPALILQTLFDAHPNDMTRAEIEAATGYKETSVRTYLPTLVGLEFATTFDDRYRAANEFFE